MCNKMSDVRLSNASPTLERVDARQPDNARPPVCRNLFGAPDREETRRYFRDVLQAEQRDFAERYDFDPVSDRPLSPHNYSWEEVSDAPEYFYRPPHRRQHGNVDLRCDNDDRDAEERSGRHSDPQPDRNDSKKRPTEAPGACSSESQSKRSRTNGGDDADDDEDRSAGPGSQSVSVVKQKPSRLDNGTQVQ